MTRAATARSSERILVVGPYPPWRDGIGNYAVQQVKALRSAGHHVEVLSPRPSAAHHHLDLVGPRHMAAFARLLRRFDRAIVHFHPDVFYPHPATPGQRLSQGLALAAALRCGPPVELRLHEIDHRWGTEGGPAAAATRTMLRSAGTVAVHDRVQAGLLVESFGLPPERVQVVDHGAGFVRRTTADRQRARQTLGIDQQAKVFLCIGFIAPHKGFDRALHAFRRLGVEGDGVQLHIVGAVNTDSPEIADHADLLRRLAATIPGAHLHLGYVGDEMFDRWIVAADCVVLPYRRIWSSSVAERAALYDRPVIATSVGGLPEQLGHLPHAEVVPDDAALAAAMAGAAGVARTVGDTSTGAAAADGAGGGTATPRGPGGPGGYGSWPSLEEGVAAIQAEVRRRSEASRGFPLAADRRSARPGRQRGPATAVTPASPLRRVHPLVRPKAVSARPGVSLLKRLTRRLIAWEIDPIVEQIDRVQRASLESMEALTGWVDERFETLEHAGPAAREPADGER